MHTISVVAKYSNVFNNNKNPPKNKKTHTPKNPPNNDVMQILLRLITELIMNTIIY